MMKMHCITKEKRPTNKLKIFFVFLLIFSIPLVSAEIQSQTTDSIPPKILVPKDIYLESKIPVQVTFVVTAIDNVDGKTQVQCDKISGSIFKLGKTRVTCESLDKAGNRQISSFIVTIGYEIVQIPQWVKTITKFWVENSIDDKTYSQTIQFLIQERIVKVPISKISNYYDVQIPSWIKTNANYWIEDNISDDEYSIMLQWLIKHGIIQV